MGEAIRYNIVATNTGSDTVTAMTLVDTLPPVITNVFIAYPAGFSPPSWMSVPGGTRYVVSGSSLTMFPMTSYTFTITGQIGPLCAAVTVRNTAFIEASGVPGTVKYLSGPTTFTVNPPAASMSVSKQQTPATGTSLAPGTPVTYRIVVTNTAADTFYSLVVIDTVSPIVTSVTPSQPAPFLSPVVVSAGTSGTRYVWSEGGLVFGPGASFTFTLVGTVGGVGGAPTVSNTAYAIASTGCLLVSQQSAPVVFIAAPQLAYSVSKVQSPPSAGIGQPVTWRLLVTNTGTATITSMTIVDTVSVGQPGGGAVVLSATPSQPSGWSAPVRTSVAGTGTRFVWSSPGGMQLAPSASLTFTLAGTVGLVCAPTAISNTAFLAATDGATTVTRYSNAVGSSVAPHATTVAVSKMQTPTTGSALLPGESVTWRIVVTNTGSATITSLALSDTVSVGSGGAGTVVAGVAASQPGTFGLPLVTSTVSGTRYDWSAAGLNVLPGQSYTFTLTGTVGAAAPGTAVSNTAWVNGTSDCAAFVQQSGAVGFTVAAVPAGSVSVGMQDDTPGFMTAGGSFRYRVSWSNGSAATANAVVIVDTIPTAPLPLIYRAASLSVTAVADGAGTPTVTMEYAATTGGPWNPGEPPDGTTTPLALRWTVSRVVPGGSGELSFTVSTSGTMSATLLENHVSTDQGAEARDAINMPVYSAVSVTTPPPAIEFQLWQAPPDPALAAAGNVVTYRICYSNVGNVSVQAVTLTVGAGSFLERTRSGLPTTAWGQTGIPSGTWATSLSGPWNTTSSAGMGDPLYLRWILPIVGIHRSGYLSFKADVLPGSSACLSAYVSATMWDGPLSGNYYEVPYTATATGGRLFPAGSALSLTKTHAPASPTPGGSVTYTLMATNLSASPITGLTIVDTLPAGITFDSESNSMGLGHSSAGAVHAWSGALALAPGASGTVSINATVDLSTTWTVENAAWAGSAIGCGLAVATSLIDSLMAVSPPVPVIEVTSDRSVVAPGDVVTYMIAYTNPGGTPDWITITDTLPPYMHYVAGSANIAPDPGWDPDPGPPTRLRWTIPSPVGSGTLTVTFQATVDWGNGEAFEPGSGDVAAPQGTVLTNATHLSWALGASSGAFTGPSSTVLVDWFDLTKTSTGTTDATYTILVKNRSTAKSYWNVTVWDSVPAALDPWMAGNGFEDPCLTWSMTPSGCPAGSPTKQVSGGTTLLRWSLGTLASQASAYLRWRAPLNGTVGTCTSVVNSAQVRAAGQTGGPGGSGPSGVPASVSTSAAHCRNWAPPSPTCSAWSAGLISTIAGTGSFGYNGDGIAATTAELYDPYGVAVDMAGHVYVAEASNRRIRRVDAVTGLISTVAGTGVQGYNGDGIPATSAQLATPQGVVVDSAGNVYIGDAYNHRVRRVDATTGLIGTVAGTGVQGYNGDGIPATSAMLDGPWGVAVDSAGNVYVSDRVNQRIRRVDSVTGLISTVAGTGTQGYNGDGISATSADLYLPAEIALDEAGHLFLAEPYGHRIRRVDAGTGLISTVAGTGTQGASADGIAATAADLDSPHGVVVDAAGNLFVGETGGHRVRRVDAVTGLISTAAGTGSWGFNGDGIAATAAEFRYPSDVALDASCRLLVVDGANQRVRRVDTSPLPCEISIATTVFHDGSFDEEVTVTSGSSLAYVISMTDRGATELIDEVILVDTAPGFLVGAVTTQPAGFGPPVVTSVPGSGTRYVWSATGLNWNPSIDGPLFFTISGTAGSVAGAESASNTAFVHARTSCGELFQITNVIRTTVVPPAALSVRVRATPAPAFLGSLIEVVATVSNTGGADLPSTAVTLTPDVGGGLVQLVSGPLPAGTVWLGPGGSQSFTWTYSATAAGGVRFTATASGTHAITGTIVGARGLGMIGITASSCPPGTGTITTLAGTGTWASGPDGIPAAACDLPSPSHVAVDPLGNVYIVTQPLGGVRRVDAVSGLVSTVMDDGGAGFASCVFADSEGRVLFTMWGALQLVDAADGRVIKSWATGDVRGLTMDGAGNVFYAHDAQVFRIDGGTDAVTIVAGIGSYGYNGDGIAATSAELNAPGGLALDAGGNLYIADYQNNRVRRVEASTGIITTVAGDGSFGRGGEDVVAVGSPLGGPWGLGEAGGNRIYIAEFDVSRVRLLDLDSGLIATVAGSATAGFAGDGGAATAALLNGPNDVAALPGCGFVIADEANNRVRVVGAPWIVTPPCPSVVASTSLLQIPATPGTGEAVTYAIVVANTGSATLEAMSVLATVPPVVTGQVAAAPAGFGAPAVSHVAGGTRYVWSGTGLAVSPGGTLTFTVTGQVGAVCVLTAAAAGADVEAATACSATAVSATAPGFTVGPAVKGFTAAVTLDPAAPADGEAVTYRIDVTNIGGATLDALSVTDTVSPAIAVTGYEAPAAFGAPGIWHVGSGTRFVWSGSGLGMTPGTVYTFTISGVVSACTAPSIVNQRAQVTGEDGCGRAEGLSNAVGFTATPAAGSVPARVAATVIQSPPPGSTVATGDWVTYLIVAANPGPAAVESLTVRDEVSGALLQNTVDQPAPFGPPVMTVAGSTTTYTWSASGLGMNPGTSYSFTVTGQLGAAAASATIGHYAVLTAASACGATEVGAEAAFLTPGPVLAIVVTVEQDPVAPATGELLTYRLVVANTGEATVKALTVVDTIPPGLGLPSSDQPAEFGAPVVTGVAGGNRHVWTASGLTMGPGTVYTFTVTGIVNLACAPATVTNTAWAEATVPGATAESAAAAAGYTAPVPVSAFEAAMSRIPGAPGIGEPVTYAIVVRNAGSATVETVTVTATIPPVITGQAAGQPAGFAAPAVAQVAGGTRYVWSATGLSVSPGSSLTFTVTGAAGAVCTATGAAAAAEIEAATACAATLLSASEAGFTVGPAVADVTAVLTVTPPAPADGETVVFRVDVTNTGSATLNDLSLTATIPAVIGVLAVDAPPPFGVPGAWDIVSGTRFVWAGMGVAMTPGTTYTFTLSGAVLPCNVGSNVNVRPQVTAVEVCGRIERAANEEGFTATPLAGSVPAQVTASLIQDPPEGATLVAGATVRYLIVAANPGPATVRDVTVTDEVQGTLLNQTAEQSAPFGPPAVSYGATATTYVWSATGLAMAPGDVFTFTMTGQVGVVAVPTAVSNYAVLNAASRCGGTLAGTETRSFKAGPPYPSIAVVKVLEPPAPVTGDRVTYRIVVRNTGFATIDALTVSDTLASALTAQAADQPPEFGAPSESSVTGGTRYVWSAAALSMAPGASYTFTLTGSVSAVCATVTVGNTAWAAATNAFGADVRTAVSGAFPVMPAVASLHADKDLLGGGSTTAGDGVGYRIVVTNTGSATIRTLRVMDTISPLIVAQSADQPPAMGVPAIAHVAGGTRYVWSASGLSLAPGESYTFTVTGASGVVGSAVAVCNTAMVDGSSDCSVTGTRTGGVTHTVTPPVWCAVETPASHVLDPVSAPGEPVTYRIIVANNGAATITALTVVDTVSPLITAAVTTQPPGFAAPTVASVPGTGTRYEWSATGLSFEPGAAALQFTVEGTVGETCGATQLLTSRPVVLAAGACGASATVGLDGGNVSATITAPSAGLSVSKSHAPPSPAPGGVVTYTIVVTNTGAATLASLAIADSLPGEVTYGGTQANTGGLAFALSGAVVGWSGPLVLGPGGTVTATIEAVVNCAAVSVSNAAYVRGMGSCGTVEAAGAADVFTVTPVQLSLEVSETQSPSGPLTGEPVTYRIVVTNTGAATIQTLEVADTVSAVLTGQASEGPAALGAAAVVQAAGTGTRYVWSGAALNMTPGTSFTFTITGVAGPVCAGTPVVNRALATASGDCGATALAGPAVSFTALPPALGVAVDKVQLPANPGIGEPVQYMIVVTNTGAATIRTLALTDTLSPVLTGVTASQSAPFTAPVVTSVPGSGTRYDWAATGLIVPPGGTLAFTLNGTVGTVCSPATVANEALVLAADECAAVRALSAPPAVFTVAPPGAALWVNAAMLDPTAVRAGDPVTYRVDVTNTGAATLETLAVTATLPASFVVQGTDQPAAFGPPAAVAVPASGTRYAWSASGLSMTPGITYSFTVTGIAGEVAAVTTVCATADVASLSSCSAAGVTAGPACLAVSPACPLSPPPTLTVTRMGAGTDVDLHWDPPVSCRVITRYLVYRSTCPSCIKTCVGVVDPSLNDWTDGGLDPSVPYYYQISVRDPAGNESSLAPDPAVVAPAPPPPPPPPPPPVTSELRHDIAVSETEVRPGDLVRVVMTVTNTGTGPAAAVTPSLTATGVAWPCPFTRISDPSPASEPVLPPGGSCRFTWTFSATGTGPGEFTGHPIGTDQNSGFGVSAQPKKRRCSSYTPARLRCGFSVSPPPRVTGRECLIVLTVTNDGGYRCAKPRPELTLGGGGTVVVIRKPGEPAGEVTIEPGGSHSFTWTLSPTAPGEVCFSASVSGETLGGRTGVATASACAAIEPPAEPVERGKVKIVGGIRGYVNPKRGEQATILVRPESPGEIRVRIYTMDGVLIWDTTQSTGGGHTEVVQWRGVDAAGRQVPPGLYPILIEAPGIRYRDKLVVVR